MLLAGILWARPESVTAYSAKPPAAELMTRSPGLKSFTSAPTASTSPAHSRPTIVPVPPTVPCRWPDATARSARLSEAARTLIRISLGLGEGFGASRTSTPFSPTTAAFMTISLDFAGSALPVAIAQQAFIELSGGMARQLGFEVDAARAFEGRQMLAAIGHQLLGQGGARVFPVARLHNSLHFL